MANQVNELNTVNISNEKRGSHSLIWVLRHTNDLIEMDLPNVVVIADEIDLIMLL